MMNKYGLRIFERR